MKTISTEGREKSSARKLSLGMAVLVAGIFAAAPVMADKPSSKGGGKQDRDNHQSQDRRGDNDRRDNDRRGDNDGRSSGRAHFEDRHRTIVTTYYTEQSRGGHCPPGLAKKHNGCMPPGQAKKWDIGRPLPRDVVYYSVPQPILVQIGPPPSGHRYVRVGGDILMLAIGTGMVIDAIQNLGG